MSIAPRPRLRLLKQHVTLLMIMLSLPILAGCEVKRDEVYEIPDGYEGWVRIEFNRPECPPLPQRGHAVLYPIGNNGTLCTKDRMPIGWSTEDYFSVGARGRRKLPTYASARDDSLVWGEATTTVGDDLAVAYIFFVGSKSEYEDAVKGKTPPARAKTNRKSSAKGGATEGSEPLPSREASR